MVLIIDTVKRNAASIADMFHYMGILSRAVSADEALAEISPLYRAVLISNPSGFPDVEDFIKRLTSYCAGIPIFSISDNPDRCALSRLFDKNYSSDVYSSSLASDIIKIQGERKIAQIGTYRLAGIDASCDMKRVTVLNSVIPYTKTETMILRYLIVTYPTPQHSRAILDYAFKPGRRPEVASIRTHVSAINRKSRERRGRSIIAYVADKGYVIATPEIMRELKLQNADRQPALTN